MARAAFVQTVEDGVDDEKRERARRSVLGANGVAESRPSHVAISGVTVRVLVVRLASLAVDIDILSASCSLQAMATRKAAESTLYHLSPRGFWKKFRDAVVINPEISTGLPIADRNRYPQPASRPEKYATPATKASDPAQNPYWKRDVRRAYPRTSVVTQTELSTLLLDHAKAEAVAAPGEAQASEATSVPAEQPAAVDLTEAIATITSARKAYSESKLPPVPPIPFKRWRPERVEDPPHDPHAYFPMLLVK